MKKDQVRRDQFRAKLWVDAWIAVATSATCKTSDVAKSWADSMLKALDERFPELKPPVENKSNDGVA